MKKLPAFLIFVLFFANILYAQSKEGVKRAVLVGVAEYGDKALNPLPTTTNDVNDLAKLLEKIGFAPENIVILKSQPTQISLRPTQRNILREIDKATNASGPDDILFIMLTGHGIERGDHSYFCAEDTELDDIQATGIRIDEKVRNLEGCDAVFKWVVVDACRDSRYFKGLGDNIHLTNPPEGVALLQSCASGERSKELDIHGLFMEQFLAAFQPENSDTNHDGKLSFQEICEYAKRRTQEVSNHFQNPTLDYRGKFQDFDISIDMNRVKAEEAYAEAKKLRLAGNLTDANAQIDLALANFSSDEKYLEEKRAIQKEQKIQDLETQIEKLKAWPAEKPTPTSRASFEWEGTKITKFIGKETDVVIPEGVTMIGKRAFWLCDSLTSVVIPEGVKVIGNDAFNSCSSLTSVVIPDSVQEIREGVFEDCAALKEWSISSTHPYFKTDGTGLLTKDGKKLIACAGSATEYRIPEGVTEIGEAAFAYCRSLTSVVIPEGVTTIGERAFWHCSSLTSMAIPVGVTEIGKRAFCGCSSLMSVVIPEGVVMIGRGAFWDCNSLTSVVIPKGVMIGEKAFSGCKSLTSVVIPKGVTVIGTQAFSGCSSLMSVEIPEGVTEIKYETFDGCSSLTSVVIPEGVTVIEISAFLKCSSLTSVVIPDSVQKIDNGAFGHCSSLTSVVIPDSVQEIDGGAFMGCTALKQWPISADHPYFKTDGAGLLTKDGKKLVACLASATEYRIPEGVTVIGGSAFSGCSSLTSVVIPEGVTTIGDWAFGYCSSLTSVEIPESVTKIGGSTFYGCPKLTIHAPKGSKADEYAKEYKKEYKIQFKTRY